jgi:dihydroxyacetone kinase/dihydroxyacetone kinase-like protein
LRPVYSVEYLQKEIGFMESNNLALIVRTMADTIIANENYFSELDGVVGDGDFGYSLARGFEIVLQDWDALDNSSPSHFLKAISTIIIGRVGGVSGIIWGTAFLRASMTLATKIEVSKEDVIASFRNAVEGIQKRGQAELGDKTLLDALVPAINQLEASFQKGEDSRSAIEAAAVVARQSAEATRPMLAKRGRASYSGERSIGSLDAGAVAVAVLFEAVSKAWKA